MIIGILLCVLGQDKKFQNPQVQKRVVIAKNNIILLYMLKRKKEISESLSVKENILLQFAMVHLTNNNNLKSVNVRVLFNSGS